MLSIAPAMPSSDLDYSPKGPRPGALSPREAPQFRGFLPTERPQTPHLRPGTDTESSPSTPSTPSTPSPTKASLGYNQDVTRPLHEYHSGYGYGYTEEEEVEPVPLASPRAPIHSRGQSLTTLTNFLPASIRARLQSPEHKPQPQQPSPEDDDDDEMALTGDSRKYRRESAMSAMSLPPQQTEGPASPETTPKRLVRSQTAGPTDTTPKNTAQAPAPSRMSLLSIFSKSSPPEVTPAMHEELLHLDVEQALFPPSSPASKDPFSPAAFKNLQTQATGLLTKMQNAYRQKAQALADFEREREAQSEELEEAETRAKHLKLQLEDMAQKAAEQERHMKQLMDELVAERRSSAHLAKRLPPGLQSEAGSTISEDLGVDYAESQKRTWRKSNGTDTSFETDDDSLSFEGESVFSRPRSPSASTFTTTRGVETGSVIDMPLPTPTSIRTHAANRMSVASSRKSTHQMTTFQKLMKGISGEGGGDGCRNCKGQDASIVWDTVSLLRDENRGLKQRVGELEDCLEGALDVVNGIGL